MLHYLDDLDSKMESMRAQFERESDLDSAWTSYNPSLGRPLLNTQKFLEHRPPQETPAATPETQDLFAEPEPTRPANHSAEPAAHEAQKSGGTPTLDALQKKFALNKPTPVGAKTE